ncbi:hypothetical protein DER44DRAFT_745212 [Fusarium oxysporum]|nr:hypothetical protein DER44DRAFT_745212 [Fusarium oxysporum]
MKPVAILLVLASTACTLSAGLPRFAKCTAASQCNSNYCAPMSHADCDEVVNCRERLRTGTNYLKIVYAMVLQWNLRVRMTGNATPTIARLLVLDSEINVASRSVEPTFKGICNALVIR